MTFEFFKVKTFALIRKLKRKDRQHLACHFYTVITNTAGDASPAATVLTTANVSTTAYVAHTSHADATSNATEAAAPSTANAASSSDTTPIA